jgi:hypothetical protein
MIKIGAPSEGNYSFGDLDFSIRFYRRRNGT